MILRLILGVYQWNTICISNFIQAFQLNSKSNCRTAQFILISSLSVLQNNPQHTFTGQKTSGDGFDWISMNKIGLPIKLWVSNLIREDLRNCSFPILSTDISPKWFSEVFQSMGLLREILWVIHTLDKMELVSFAAGF